MHACVYMCVVYTRIDGQNLCMKTGQITTHDDHKKTHAHIHIDTQVYVSADKHTNLHVLSTPLQAHDYIATEATPHILHPPDVPKSCCSALSFIPCSWWQYSMGGRRSASLLLVLQPSPGSSRTRCPVM